MIAETKLPAAYEALHKILIQLRAWGYNGEDPRKIADALDTVEYLITLLSDPEEKSSEYERHLQDLAGEFEALGIGWNAYQEELR